MRISREEFIEICINKNFSKDASVIFDNDEEYNLFMKTLRNKEFNVDAKSGEKIALKRKIEDFKDNKIKRLNFQEREFEELYKESPEYAIEQIFQVNTNGKIINELCAILERNSEAAKYLFKEYKKASYPMIGNIILRIKVKYEKEYNEVMIINQHKKQEAVTKSKEKRKDYKTIASSTNKEKIAVISCKFKRNSTIASCLKEKYNHKCQVCGIQLSTPIRYKSEAHHIQPYNEIHKGDDCWSNMLVVCPNCHLQFDELYYAIEPITLVIHCFDETNVFHGTKIKLQPGHQLESKYLEYAWNRFLKMKSVAIETY